MLQLLIVANDSHTSELLAKPLIFAGYQVKCTCDVSRALSYQKNSHVNLVIIDMPVANKEVLKFIDSVHKNFATPMLLSSPATDNKLLLSALQAGADQYLQKPYCTDTLLMCINVLLRRVALEKQRLAIQSCSESLSLKISRLQLTETEMLLVQYLSENGEQIVSKATLQKEVLKKDLSVFDRNLDVHISNIRRKMFQAGLSKRHIKTVHGKGYRFSEKLA